MRAYRFDRAGDTGQHGQYRPPLCGDGHDASSRSAAGLLDGRQGVEASGARLLAPCGCFSTKASRAYTEVSFSPGDFLVFGKETAGIPEEILRAHWDTTVRIPMMEGARSINLSNAVAIASYEALRQLSFPGLRAVGRRMSEEGLSYV